MSVYTKLAQIQQELKVTKDKENDFAHFRYRTCSDILIAVKPLLSNAKATLFITDDLEIGNDRNYIKATVTFVDIETSETIKTTALAREAVSKTKMDDAQITGASSSYARKYALCGLFCIDDSTNDPDSQPPPPQPMQQQSRCQQCGNGIIDVIENGKKYLAKQTIANSLKKYNAQLCFNCMKTLKQQNGGN